MNRHLETLRWMGWRVVDAATATVHWCVRAALTVPYLVHRWWTESGHNGRHRVITRPAWQQRVRAVLWRRDMWPNRAPIDNETQGEVTGNVEAQRDAPSWMAAA